MPISPLALTFHIYTENDYWQYFNVFLRTKDYIFLMDEENDGGEENAWVAVASICHIDWISYA